MSSSAPSLTQMEHPSLQQILHRVGHDMNWNTIDNIEQYRFELGEELHQLEQKIDTETLMQELSLCESRITLIDLLRSPQKYVPDIIEESKAFYLQQWQQAMMSKH